MSTLYIILIVLVVIGIGAFFLIKHFLKEKRGVKTGWDSIKNIDTKFKMSVEDIMKDFDVLPKLFEFRAKKHPDRIMFTWLNSLGEETDRVTYLQAFKIITGLRKDYFKKLKGKKCLIIMQPSLEYSLTFLACLYAGVIAVPVYPPREYKKSVHVLVSIAEDCGAKHIISTSSIHAKIMIAFLSISKEFNPRKYKWVKIPSLSSMQKKYKKVYNKVKKFPKPSDLAYLQYTSGSTSLPKGVMISHRNIMRQMEVQFLDYLGGHHFSAILWIPSYHSTGLVLCVLSEYISGATHICFHPMVFVENPSLFIETMHRYECYMTITPNFGFDLMSSKVPDKIVKKFPIPKICRIICGAEPILSRTMRRFQKKFNFNGFVNGYGLTEATLVVSMTKDAKLNITKFKRSDLEKGIVTEAGEKDDGIELVGNGTPLWKYGMDVRFVDPDTKKECASNRVGEIFVKDDCIAMGYYKKQEETKKTFYNSFVGKDGKRSEECYLRTGDLGFVHKNILFISGRIKDIIIIRGRNLYNFDIEKAVTDCHEKNAKIGCIAFAISNYGGVEEEQLVIVQEIQKANEKDDLSEVFEKIRETVNDEFHCMPSYVVLIKDKTLPRTASHKVARNKCRKEFIAGNLSVIAQKTYKEKENK